MFDYDQNCVGIRTVSLLFIYATIYAAAGQQHYVGGFYF